MAVGGFTMTLDGATLADLEEFIVMSREGLKMTSKLVPISIGSDGKVATISSSLPTREQRTTVLPAEVAPPRKRTVKARPGARRGGKTSTPPPPAD